MVANFASIPTDINDPLVSLPIYTSLFNKLGFAGIGCTVIALAMLPLMNKLSASHSDASDQQHAAAARAQRGIQHPVVTRRPPCSARRVAEFRASPG